MINTYTFEDDILTVVKTESKTLVDVQRIIKLGKPARVLDHFIELYLPTQDPAQIAADNWYEQQVLVETLDPDEQRFTRTFIDENNEEQSETLPNPYEVASTELNELENSNPWLLGLRGLDSPERPEFVLDIQEWKNAHINVRDARQQRYIAELSEEGTFEKSVGDCLDAIIDFLMVDPSKLTALKTKIDSIKADLPKS